MAFRTNIMPVLQEKSASGAVATFNTALAMPLVKGEFSIMAYQEGSGYPSPSNIRNIVGYSEVNITHNAEVKTKQLGEDVYGGSYNIDGTKRKTYAKYILDGSVKPDAYNYRPQANSVGCYWNNLFPFKPPLDINTPANVICDKLATVSYGVWYSNDIDSIAFTKPTTIYRLCVRFKDTTLTTQQAVCDYLECNPITIVYETENVIETDIGATPISTNIGSNTIFADTGDIDLTYKDFDIAKRGNFREVFKLPS